MNPQYKQTAPVGNIQPAVKPSGLHKPFWYNKDVPPMPRANPAAIDKPPVNFSPRLDSV